MVVMSGGIVLRRVVALMADAVAVGTQLERVRIVAVAAADPLLEHLALPERGVVVDLVHHLAIGFEQARPQQARHMGLEQLLARPPAFGDLGAARMTDAAGRELLGAGPRHAALGIAGSGIDGPKKRPGARRSEARDRRRGLRSRATSSAAVPPMRCGPSRDRGRPRSRRQSRPSWWHTCRCHRSSCAARSGGTRRTEVPGLVDPGPMQRITSLRRLIGIEMEPALPALIGGPGVPRGAERLDPAVRQRDQILLQRVDAEGVADLEVVEVPIRRIGGDEEFPVTLEKPRSHAGVDEARVVRSVSAVASCIARSWWDPRQPRSRSRDRRRKPRCRQRSGRPQAAREKRHRTPPWSPSWPRRWMSEPWRRQQRPSLLWGRLQELGPDVAFGAIGHLDLVPVDAHGPAGHLYGLVWLQRANHAIGRTRPLPEVRGGRHGVAGGRENLDRDESSSGYLDPRQRRPSFWRLQLPRGPPGKPSGIGLAVQRETAAVGHLDPQHLGELNMTKPPLLVRTQAD